MKGKLLLYGFWLVATAVLAIMAIGYQDSASSILAEVEPQRYAVSYQKPVKIKEIYVIPGQRVKKGEKLIRVERPDLLLDAERKENNLQALISEQKIKDIERVNKLELARITFEQKILKLNVEKNQLDLLLDQNEQMSHNLKNLNLLSDSIQSLSPDYIRLRIELIQKEIEAERMKHQLEKSEINQVYNLEQQNRNLERQQLEQEIVLLRQEENEQIQYAHVDGTIGNVYSEDEELVPPYETLISVYEENPTVIRALVNEHMKIEVKSGDEVIVESTNRKYKISGKVMEIGSRIIEYPNRLNEYVERPKWGRELFIKIPKSDFLNGEKVFVKLE